MQKLAMRLVLIVLGSAALGAQVQSLVSPADQGSAEPNLTITRDGVAMLSWIDKAAAGHVLRFAVREGDGWSKPKQIAAGDNWFVNWADFPSLVSLPDGRLAAHWLVKSAKGTYDYDVHVAMSANGGDTWGKSLVPHRDGKKAEHGFVSLLPNADNSLSAFWLDGRAMKPADDGHGRGAMTLRYVEIMKTGELRRGAMLDARVCECCQTSAAMTALGPVIVFRDRSEDEVRDISIVRRVDGEWTKSQPVCRDGWQVAGCPVNGPSVAAAAKHVVVGWFTAADNTGRVKLARSRDGGVTFTSPVIVDRGNPAGRVETVVLPDGTAWVCWLTRLEQGAAVRARRVALDGTMAAAVTVAMTGAERRNGFPQVVHCGGELLFAWTNDGVKCAIMPLK